MTPDTNYGESSTAPEISYDSQLALNQKAELEARVKSLEADLELILKGKEAAERTLRYERERSLELARNGTLCLKKDWVGLANELKILKGEVLSDSATQLENEQYREAKIIDFVNVLRIGALASLEEDSDDIVYVKAQAYEIFYRAASATLANRSLRVKLERRDSFEESKKTHSAAKVVKEKEKLDRKRPMGPEERLKASLTAAGLSEDEIKEHFDRLVNAAKTMKPQ